MSAPIPSGATTAVDMTADLDASIRRLFDQQTELQTRLSALLAARHNLDAPRELDMLRYKQRVLENLVERHGMYLP
jgi:hypothetical protein